MNDLDRRECGHFALEIACSGCFEGMGKHIAAIEQEAASVRETIDAKPSEVRESLSWAQDNGHRSDAITRRVRVLATHIIRSNNEAAENRSLRGETAALKEAIAGIEFVIRGGDKDRALAECRAALSSPVGSGVLAELEAARKVVEAGRYYASCDAGKGCEHLQERMVFLKILAAYDALSKKQEA